MLAAYLLIVPHMPNGIHWMLDYMGMKEMLGLMAGVSDLKLTQAIYRSEWGIRERFDVKMKAAGL